MTEAKSEAIETKRTGVLAPAPDWSKAGDNSGTENIGRRDLSIPRLALAQLQSPECTEGDPNAVPGLKPGMLFNSQTKQVYGTKVRVQVIRKDPPRAMEFYPIDSGGGVKDPDVPMDDPRLKWGQDGEKPQATEFRDYIAVLLPSREIIALSFKSSGIKVAKQLNGLIKMRNRPIFDGAYAISTAQQLVPKPHRVFVVENDDWVTREDSEAGRQMWEAVKDMDVEIDREGKREDPEDDFPPVNTREPGDEDQGA